LVSTESGTVKAFDARTSGSKPLWTLHAHDAAVSALDINPLVPECLVTGASDKTVKIWSLKDGQPRMVVSREMDVGRIFAATFCPDQPSMVAISGTKGSVALWNLSAINGVVKAFGSVMEEKEKKEKKEILMPESDSDQSEHEDEMEWEEQADE
jgi:periodic tryptophan protein 1